MAANVASAGGSVGPGETAAAVPAAAATAAVVSDVAAAPAAAAATAKAAPAVVGAGNHGSGSGAGSIDPVSLAQFERWAVCFAVVMFDLELGPTIERVYPSAAAAKLTKAELSNVCNLSFPDSNMKALGDMHFTFRMRIGPKRDTAKAGAVAGSGGGDDGKSAPATVAEAEADDADETASVAGAPASGTAAAAPQSAEQKAAASAAAAHDAQLCALPASARGFGFVLPDQPLLYGYVCFRQRRDASIARGYFQKSVVCLSALPCVTLFERVVGQVASTYFRVGASALEAVAQDVARWPHPTPGAPLELPLTGQQLKCQLPMFPNRTLRAAQPGAAVVALVPGAAPGSSIAGAAAGGGAGAGVNAANGNAVAVAPAAIPVPVMKALPIRPSSPAGAQALLGAAAGRPGSPKIGAAAAAVPAGSSAAPAIPLTGLMRSVSDSPAPNGGAGPSSRRPAAAAAAASSSSSASAAAARKAQGFGSLPHAVPLASSLTLSEAFDWMHHASASGGGGWFQGVNLYHEFRHMVSNLWVLWELMLCGEPVLLIAPTAAQSSRAVLALVSLIAPVVYRGDFRPYYTIYDADFRHFCDRHDAAVAAAAAAQKKGRKKDASVTGMLAAAAAAASVTPPPPASPTNGSGSPTSPDDDDADDAPDAGHGTGPGSNGDDLMPRAVFGVTNPFFLKALGKLPHIVCIGENRSTKTGAVKPPKFGVEQTLVTAFPKSAGTSGELKATAGASVLVTRYKPVLVPSKTALSRLITPPPDARETKADGAKASGQTGKDKSKDKSKRSGTASDAAAPPPPGPAAGSAVVGSSATLAARRTSAATARTPSPSVEDNDGAGSSSHGGSGSGGGGAASHISEINSAVLRKAFVELTELFLRPFRRYYLVPPHELDRIRGDRWNPYLDLPQLPRFVEHDLLTAVREHTTTHDLDAFPVTGTLARTQRKRLAGLYLRFCRAPHFGPWLHDLRAKTQSLIAHYQHTQIKRLSSPSSSPNDAHPQFRKFFDGLRLSSALQMLRNAQSLHAALTDPAAPPPVPGAIPAPVPGVAAAVSAHIALITSFIPPNVLRNGRLPPDSPFAPRAEASSASASASNAAAAGLKTPEKSAAPAAVAAWGLPGLFGPWAAPARGTSNGASSSSSASSSPAPFGGGADAADSGAAARARIGAVGFGSADAIVLSSQPVTPLPAPLPVPRPAPSGGVVRTGSPALAAAAGAAAGGGSGAVGPVQMFVDDALPVRAQAPVQLSTSSQLDLRFVDNHF